MMGSVLQRSWPMSSRVPFVLVLGLMLAGAVPAGAQQVAKQTVPGVTNFARLETTVACGGATKPEAVPELKKMGFSSIINLRLPTEAGAMVEEEGAAAKAAGISYFNIPFNGQQPDPAVATRSSRPSRPRATNRRTFIVPAAIALV